MIVQIYSDLMILFVDVVISTTNSSIVECCQNDSLSEFCFYTDQLTMGENSKKHYFCLNARQFTTGLHCVETNDCFKPEQSVCLHPSLDEQSRLFRIVHNGPKDVIFVGHPLLLHQSSKGQQKPIPSLLFCVSVHVFSQPH
jgi:hypothetical protein